MGMFEPERAVCPWNGQGSLRSCRMDVDETGFVGRVVDSFLERRRRGERPTIDEYAQRYPEHAEKVREVLNAIDEVEELRAEGVRSDAPRQAVGAPSPEKVGEYRVLREIGRGGMGIVYEAVQESLGRHVALKVLPVSGIGDPQRLQRFQREARAAAALHHSNIVPVFAVGEDRGVHYIAMQFVHGHPLDEVLEEVRSLRVEIHSGDATSAQPASAAALSLLRRGDSPCTSQGENPVRCGPREARSARGRPKASPSQEPDTTSLVAAAERTTNSGTWGQYFLNAARLTAQVADALAHAHGEGILHRDIKPSNLLIDVRGDVWLTDFGLAKAQDSETLTQTGDLFGTVPYMAPERFRGWSDPRSDIYGLGMTLYELVTLRPGFSDPDRARLIQKVTHDEPPRPRKLEPRLPRDLETILLKATEKDAERRYQSASDLAADLRLFLDDEPICARRTSILERGWRWCRRNRAVTAFAATTVILLLVVSAALLVMGRIRHERDEARSQTVRAEWAERESRFWSHVADSRRIRWSGRPGQVFESERELVGAAAELTELALEDEELEKRRLTLRNEIIACETRVDLKPSFQWSLPASWTGAIDGALEHYTLGDDNGGISVRRVEDRKEVGRLPGFGLSVKKMLFSPNSILLAAVYSSGEVRIWEWRRRAEVVAFRCKNHSPQALGFSADSRRFAVGSQGGLVSLYDMERGTQDGAIELRIDSAPFLILRFDPRGDRLAALRKHAGAVLLVNLESRRVFRKLAHARSIHQMAWHPDGKILAVGSDDTRIHLWNTETGELIGHLADHEAQVVTLEFSHAGDLLLSRGWDETVRVWDPMSQRLLLTKNFYGAGFFPRFSLDDSSSIWLRVDSTMGFTAEIYRLASGRVLRKLYGHEEIRNGPWCVDVSPDGRLLVSGGLDDTRLWDLASSNEIARLPVRLGELGKAIFHPSGEFLITAGPGGVHRWPLAREVGPGGEVVRVGPRRPSGLCLQATSGWSSLGGEGRILAVVEHRNQPARVFDLATGSRRLVGQPEPGISFVDVSPDGKWIVTAVWAWDVLKSKVWNVSNGKLVRELEGTRPSFSPDGRWLVASRSFAYAFYEVPSWKKSHEVARDPPGKMGRNVAFTSDGRLCALAFTTTLVKLVEPTTGREIATLEATPAHVITDLCFSPSGDRLVAATAGHVIQVWDLRRLRDRLRDMGLDWDLPPIPPESPAATRPLRAEVLVEGSDDQGEEDRDG